MAEWGTGVPAYWGDTLVSWAGEGGEEPPPDPEPTPVLPAQPRSGVWSLFVRDGTGNRVAQLDDYTDVTIIPRFNAAGSWRFTHKNTPAATLLNGDRYGVEFVRDGEVVLSGPVTTRTRRLDAEFDGYDFAGVDDTAWLLWRLASPVPSVGGPPYSAAAYDVRTGTASTIMREYADVNAGTSATTDRRVAGLTMASDPGIGSSVTGRARWQPLIDLEAELAAASGLGFRIRRLVFEVYAPADRSAAVKFSVPLGNLAGFTYNEASPNVNYNYAAGGGEGTARVVRQMGDLTSIARWGRIEGFQDRRDTSDGFELDQANQATLAENATKVGFSLTPIETQSIRYLDSYQLGDQVTVIIDGVPIVDVVREVVITLNDQGETVVPTVGDPEADPNRPNIFAAVKRLGRDLRNLQRTV